MPPFLFTHKLRMGKLFLLDMLLILQTYLFDIKMHCDICDKHYAAASLPALHMCANNIFIKYLH